MELAFTKNDGRYIAEFQVSADFNLHIEREETGPIILYQRTTSQGEYDYVKNFGFKQDGDKVMDFDSQSLVYPKWIKIESAVKPLIATITTDGEVNEVSYQAKDIEITSNGTTKVTADTGYTALGSVNVKVNVPQSGGNGGGGLNIQYYDIVGVELDEDLLYCCVNQRWFNHEDGQVSITNIKWGTPQISAIAVCENMMMRFDWEGDGIIEEISVKDMFAKLGTSLNSLPRITEEEFYNPSNIIKFSINSEYYFAKEGMTWQQFAMSGYNNFDNEQRVLYEESHQAILYDGNPIIGNDGIGVDPHAEIISGANYTSAEVG